MYVPVQGVLSAALKHVMYQIMEYGQIFKRFQEYPDPLEYGFMEIGEGIITRPQTRNSRKELLLWHTERVNN